MLARWLITTKVLDRLGVALARLTAAGLRFRTSGRAAITNGRIWFCTIGVLGLASAVSAASAAGSERAAGSRLWAAGPSCWAQLWTLASVAAVSLSVGGRSRSAWLTLVAADANARNTFELAWTGETFCVCLVASAVFRRCSELT